MAAVPVGRSISSVKKEGKAGRPLEGSDHRGYSWRPSPSARGSVTRRGLAAAAVAPLDEIREPVSALPHAHQQVWTRPGGSAVLLEAPVGDQFDLNRSWTQVRQNRPGQGSGAEEVQVEQRAELCVGGCSNAPTCVRPANWLGTTPRLGADLRPLVICRIGRVAGSAWVWSKSLTGITGATLRWE